MFTHKLPNWDDMNQMHCLLKGRIIGRWYEEVLFCGGGKSSVPMNHGMIAILFIALAAWIVCEILEIETVSGSILIAVLMETFPSVACNMTFMYTTHTYGIAIFFMYLGAYLCSKKTILCASGGLLLILVFFIILIIEKKYILKKEDYCCYVVFEPSLLGPWRLFTLWHRKLPFRC